MDTKYLLLAIIAACLFDLIRRRRGLAGPYVTVRVLLVPGDSPCCIEGLVRCLHREFSAVDRLDVEIAVSKVGAPAEFCRIAELLERDEFLVEELSGEPTLVFSV